MKHTATLTTLAAAALAAAVPLAVQAQEGSSTSSLSIVEGSEPVVEPIVTCTGPQPGKLIPFAFPANASSRKGEVVLFTSDVGESGISTDLAAQADGTDAAGQEPGLTFGWSYASSTATKFVRLKAHVPFDTIATTINGQRTTTSASWVTPTIATTGNGATSHVFMKSLASGANVNVSQSWDSGTNTLTVDIKKGSNGFLVARGSNALTNPDITLQAPAGLHLKKLTNGTPVTITWTCSMESYPTGS